MARILSNTVYMIYEVVTLFSAIRVLSFLIMKEPETAAWKVHSALVKGFSVFTSPLDRRLRGTRFWNIRLLVFYLIFSAVVNAVLNVLAFFY